MNLRSATARTARAARGPHLPAIVVTLILTVVAGIFVGSYSLAMADPQPRGVVVGVVEGGPNSARIENAINAQGDETFTVREYATEKQASADLDEQKIYGIFAPQENGSLRLEVSSASGASVSKLLEQRALLLSNQIGVPISVTDVHPLSSRDPSGIALFYIALAAVIIGFSGAVQLRVNATKIGVRAMLWWDVVRSALGGGSIIFVTSILLHILPISPSLLIVWVVLFAAMLASGWTYSFFRVFFGGRWALLPTWLIFVVIANPSSGGAVSPQLLPPLYEFMGRWMPTGATVEAVRNAVYFPNHQHAEPFLVLAIWILVVFILFVVTYRRSQQVQAKRDEQKRQLELREEVIRRQEETITREIAFLNKEAAEHDPDGGAAFRERLATEVIQLPETHGSHPVRKDR